VLENSLVAEQAGPRGEFELRSVGQMLRSQTGFREGSRKLTDMEDSRVAVRLRELFHFTLEQGEPVTVSFMDRGRDFEVLAAPLALDNDKAGIWCTIAATALQPDLAAAEPAC